MLLSTVLHSSAETWRLLSRPILRLAAVVRDFARSDYFEVLCLYCSETFRTDNYTVLDCVSACGFSENSFCVQTKGASSTLSTPRTPTIMGALSIRRAGNGSLHKMHSSPPVLEWRIDRDGDQAYYKDGKWIGITVRRVYHLSVHRGRCVAKVISPKSRSFRITHYDGPKGDKRVLELIEAPTLRKAQKIAEWYYSEWLRVNSQNECS